MVKIGIARTSGTYDSAYLKDPGANEMIPDIIPTVKGNTGTNYKPMP